ncbi:hypothetical protein [Nonomuraea cypriaca]|uniref:hypothetical protein n=1 Tax=Nonomuraea cypriaca TaxID=1187855 RepID=UPI001F44F89D|nr:hypothetical protein [Nonomuraea cypriaca]
MHSRADLITNPRAARGYRNLLLDAGFDEVEVEVHVGIFTGKTMLGMLTGIAEAVHAAGVITREQCDGWTAEQARRAEQNRLFLALPLFLASATRAEE